MKMNRQHPFRGAHGHDATNVQVEPVYGAMVTNRFGMYPLYPLLPFVHPLPELRRSTRIPPSTTCIDDNAFAVVNPNFHSRYCESMEPFLSTGGRCIEVVDGIAKFPWSAVGPFDIQAIKEQRIFTNFAGSANNPAITVGDASNRYAACLSLFNSFSEAADKSGNSS